jgi:hypothetical protein
MSLSFRQSWRRCREWGGRGGRGEAPQCGACWGPCSGVAMASHEWGGRWCDEEATWEWEKGDLGLLAASDGTGGGGWVVCVCVVWIGSGLSGLHG